MTRLISRAVTPPTCGLQALDDINKWNSTLTVPAGHVADYRQAAQWKEFFFIEEGTAGISHVTVGQGTDYKQLYDLNGRRQPTPQRALNIVRMGNGTVKKIIVK